MGLEDYILDIKRWEIPNQSDLYIGQQPIRLNNGNLIFTTRTINPNDYRETGSMYDGKKVYKKIEKVHIAKIQLKKIEVNPNGD